MNTYLGYTSAYPSSILTETHFHVYFLPPGSAEGDLVCSPIKYDCRINRGLRSHAVNTTKILNSVDNGGGRLGKGVTTPLIH